MGEQPLGQIIMKSCTAAKGNIKETDVAGFRRLFLAAPQPNVNTVKTNTTCQSKKTKTA